MLSVADGELASMCFSTTSHQPTYSCLPYIEPTRDRSCCAETAKQSQQDTTVVAPAIPGPPYSDQIVTVSEPYARELHHTRARGAYDRGSGLACPPIRRSP